MLDFVGVVVLRRMIATTIKITGIKVAFIKNRVVAVVIAPYNQFQSYTVTTAIMIVLQEIMTAARVVRSYRPVIIVIIIIIRTKITSTTKVTI